MIIPRFNPDFVDGLRPGSPEELFVNSVSEIDAIYTHSDVFDRYAHDSFKDFTKRNSSPLYVIDGELTYDKTPPLSEENQSEIWKRRLQEYGAYGMKLVQILDSLRFASDLLVHKKIEYMFPYKRNLNPEKGFIVGNHIDYAPLFEQGPAMQLEIALDGNDTRGLHFSIISLCNIQIN